MLLSKKNAYQVLTQKILYVRVNEPRSGIQVQGKRGGGTAVIVLIFFQEKIIHVDIKFMSTMIMIRRLPDHVQLADEEHQQLFKRKQLWYCRIRRLIGHLVG